MILLEGHLSIYYIITDITLLIMARASMQTMLWYM